MEKTLNMGTFEALDQQELFAVDGGEFTWKGFTKAVAVGAATGALAGAAAGGVGAGPGALAGGLIGGIAYCLDEIYDTYVPSF